jgi:hypothetical protein
MGYGGKRSVSQMSSIKEAIKKIKDGFRELESQTSIIGMYYSRVDDEIKVHIFNEKDFDELCRMFNRIPCLEILPYNQYPFEKYIYLDSVKIFSLLRELKEETA